MKKVVRNVRVVGFRSVDFFSLRHCEERSNRIVDDEIASFLAMTISYKEHITQTHLDPTH